MNAITRCPQCGTRYKVSQAQLEIHLGMVRCGRCHEVFSAPHYFHDDEPSPQLALPMDEGGHSSPAESKSEARAEAENVQVQSEPLVPLPAESQPRITSPAENQFKVKQPFSPWEEEDDIPELLNEQKRRWPTVTAALILFLLLLTQAFYFFRVEIAARLPGIKPVMVAGCELLQCTIRLPQHAELVSIESSELEANPTPASAITLNVIIRNNAAYGQAYPHLELTLTDMADQVLARRIFQPKEYLKAGEDENLGLEASREASIKLYLDTSDLKPSGYRLFLFYPGL